MKKLMNAILALLIVAFIGYFVARSMKNHKASSARNSVPPHEAEVVSSVPMEMEEAVPQEIAVPLLREVMVTAAFTPRFTENPRINSAPSSNSVVLPNVAP